MAIMGLNLPTDIPWEQVCRTDDMMTRKACARALPPKWHSSIAVSKYVPDEEYQIYPGRTITYLKVTCSITGYQPWNAEVEGRINWGGVSVQTESQVESLLSQYLPCTGALVQIAVSPKEGAQGFDQYPYFMDFQPQKRELYEMVTETGERSSRSSESLAVGKASGRSESLEVLDVDQGGSSKGEGSILWGLVSAGGEGSSQGQWGTKQLGTQQSSVSRSTDESREKRETQSHTTQLTQMYHLLESYHKGTNRALFYVQPRPHVLEVPTGFVRGPRGVDGIQEFFLVVNQPKESDGFVTSVRLDTSHLTVVPVMEYDRRLSEPITARASADLPTKNDPPAPREQAALRDDDGDRVGTVYYNCYKRAGHDSISYAPETGYVIDVADGGGYLDVSDNSSHGTSRVDVDPSGNGLTVVCDAESHVCKYEDHDITFGYWAPDNVEQDISKWTAFVERTVRARLRSVEKTRKVGEKNVLVITTRGLCCGAAPFDGRVLIRDTMPIMSQRNNLVVGRKLFTAVSDAAWSRARHEADLVTPAPAQPTRAQRVRNAEEPEPQHEDQPAPVSGTMTAREANELSAVIREAMIQSEGSHRRNESDPVPYLETDLFRQQLRNQLAQTFEGRAELGRSARELVGSETLERLARRFGITPDLVTRWHISALTHRDLAEISGLDDAAVRRLRLTSIGVALNDDRSAAE